MSVTSQPAIASRPAVQFHSAVSTCQVIPIAEPRLVDYARVSTDDQTTHLQLDALRAAGCVVIDEDAASGVSRSRPGLSRALADLAAGDTLVVWRLDWLGRSPRDLLDISQMLGNGSILSALIGSRLK
jgi:hypothetical protein